MKRPIFIIALGFILGIIWGLYFNIVSFIFISIIIIMLLLIKIINVHYRNNIRRIIKVFMKKNSLLIFIISVLISMLYMFYLSKKYEEIYNNFNSKHIIATVISDKKETEYKNIYKIKLENNKKIILLLQLPKKKNINVNYGDKIEINGEYTVPETSRNYKGFNYRDYLKTQKIYGIFNANDINIIKHNNISTIQLLSNSVRQCIIKNIYIILPQNISQLFLGILIGYDNVTEDIQENFRKSSLSHLLAVSGAHISYIIMGIAYVLMKLRIPKVLRNILVIIFLVFFMYITEFSSSVVRATVMGIIMLLSITLYRKNDIKTCMSISILLVLLDNPYKILDIGLLLSYIVTIGIICFSKINNKNNQNKKNVNIYKNFLFNLKEIALITVYANVFAIPIIAYNFNTISFTFIVSNLIAGLLIGPITILGIILIVISFINIKLAYIISIPYNILLKLLINNAKLVSLIPISELLVKTPSVVLIIIYYIILSILLTYRILQKKFSNRYIVKKLFYTKQKLLKFLKINLKIILLFIILITIIFYIIKKIPKDLKINFIDVGQGDSTLIITPSNKKILIDSGGSENSNFDTGKSILLPYLLDKKITYLDYIFVSHFDSDHCKGFEYVMKNIKVKNVIISKQPKDSENYKEFLKIVKERKINVIVVKNGDRINIEKDVYFYVLWPDTNNFISENTLNNNSMVCKMFYNKFSMLFTGDIEKIAEEKIQKKYQNNLQILNSTILKVAHHGSNSSSIEEILEKINPQIALIGVGKNNKFGHPNSVVIERLNNIRNKNI